MNYTSARALYAALFSVAILSLNLFWLHNPVLGIIFLILYAFSVGSGLKKSININSTMVWGMVVLISLLSLTNAAVYYAYKLTTVTSFFVLLVPLFVLLVPLFVLLVPLIFTAKKESSALNNFPKKETFNFFTIFKCDVRVFLKKEHLSTIVLMVLFFAIEIILFVLVYKSRTTDVSNSPWLHVPFFFFILYGIATALTLTLSLKTRNAWTAYLATSVHLFLTYCVVVIIYPLGHGFDGFIHRATEQWIQTHGYILPKQPVYVGQYGLVVWVSMITGIPIFYIDVLLVPLLAASLLPAIVAKTLQGVFGIEERKALNLVWVLPVIFYLSLHLTTPHNLLILISIITVFAILAYFYNHISLFVPLLLALSGVSIHALLGAPLFLFVITACIIKQYERIKTYALLVYAMTLIFLLPALFTLFFYITHKPLPDISNPVRHIYSFLILFKRPYWYEKTAPFFWETLYHWQWVLPILITLAGIVSFLYIAKKKHIADLHIIFILSFIGFWMGAFLLRSWIVFPDVGAFEQGDYPLRLIKTSIIFLLPWLMYGIYIAYDSVAKKIQLSSKKTQMLLRTSCILLASCVITLSFYLSYPQENKKVHFPGYNVTKADFEAATWINDDNEQYNYIVLSNPLTAVAAMTQYGFPKYFETPNGLHSYYAIPTGAKLFGLYQKMLYEGQRREFMLEAMEYTGAQKSYFVVSSFWSRFNQIVEGAKKTADAWHSTNDGNIFVFTYKKNPGD